MGFCGSRESISQDCPWDLFCEICPVLTSAVTHQKGMRSVSKLGKSPFESDTFASEQTESLFLFPSPFEGRQSPADNRLTAGGNWLLRFLLQISPRQKIELWPCGCHQAHNEVPFDSTTQAHALALPGANSTILIGCPLDPAFFKNL